MNELENILEIVERLLMSSLRHHVFLIHKCNYYPDAAVEILGTFRADDPIKLYVHLGESEMHAASSNRCWSYLLIIPSIILKHDEEWKRWWRELLRSEDPGPEPPAQLLEKLKYYDIYEHGKLVEDIVKYARDSFGVPQYVAYEKIIRELDIDDLKIRVIHEFRQPVACSNITLTLEVYYKNRLVLTW